MATTFDGLLGNIFGGEDQGLSDYLTPEQVSRMNTQGLMAIASSLLKSSGRSPTPISFGQALGGAYEAGQRGYESAQQGALAQLLTKQKLDEYKRSQEYQQKIANILGGTPPQAAPDVTMTAADALAVPNMPAGPTVDRAALIGTQQPAAAPVDQNEMQAQKYEKIGNIYTTQGKGEDAKRYYDLAKSLRDIEVTGNITQLEDGRYGFFTKQGRFIPAPQGAAPKDLPVGAPFEVTDENNKPVLVERYASGALRTIAGYGPKRDVVLQGLGNKVVAIDKNKVKTGAEFNVGMSASEAANLNIARQRLKISQDEFDRGQYQRVETADGMVYVPTNPNAKLPVIPITGPTGEPITTKTPPQAFTDKSYQLQNVNDAVNNFSSAISNFKTSDMLDPTRRAELGSAHARALLNAKELFNLGVLNGGDELILNKVLMSPIDFTSSAVPIEAVKKQATDLQGVIASSNKNLARAYNQKPLTLNKPAEPAVVPMSPEGTQAVSRSGRPIIVKNGKWEYQ